MTLFHLLFCLRIIPSIYIYTCVRRKDCTNEVNAKYFMPFLSQIFMQRAEGDKKRCMRHKTEPDLTIALVALYYSEDFEIFPLLLSVLLRHYIVCYPKPSKTTVVWDMQGFFFSRFIFRRIFQP